EQQRHTWQEAVLDRDHVIEPQGVVEHVDLEIGMVIDVPEAAEKGVRLPIFLKPEVSHEQAVDRRSVSFPRGEIEILEGDSRCLGPVPEGIETRGEMIVTDRVVNADTPSN